MINILISYQEPSPVIFHNCFGDQTENIRKGVQITCIFYLHQKKLPKPGFKLPSPAHLTMEIICQLLAISKTLKKLFFRSVPNACFHVFQCP